ncbi:hypothetical protein TrVFT333_004639 [Trichoderma virens FT-333]|nr:hypothetical protein TrVFT333_004639 [Trichoderma virens FT-333]
MPAPAASRVARPAATRRRRGLAVSASIPYFPCRRSLRNEVPMVRHHRDGLCGPLGLHHHFRLRGRNGLLFVPPGPCQSRRRPRPPVPPSPPPPPPPPTSSTPPKSPSTPPAAEYSCLRHCGTPGPGQLGRAFSCAGVERGGSGHQFFCGSWAPLAERQARLGGLVNFFLPGYTPCGLSVSKHFMDG